MAKILLVEDDNNLREIYEARLQAEGYTIISAKDGEEALVVAKKEKPDLIISDVMMPRISGFEMLDILRNTEGLQAVKVIMLTALGQAEDKTRADSLGADRYLVKSQVTLEDIVKAAQELLGGADSASAGGGTAAAPPGPASDSTSTTTPPATSPPPTEPSSAPATPSSPTPAVPVTPAPTVAPPAPAPTPGPTPPPAEPTTPPTPTPTPTTPSAPPVAPPVAPTPAPTPPTPAPPQPAPVTPTPPPEPPKAPEPPIEPPKPIQTTADSGVQTTSEEEAAIKSQIENFVNQNSQTAPKPVDERIMANAIKDLVSDTEDDKPESASEPKVVTPSAPTNDNVTTPSSAPAPAPAVNTKDDDGVAIAHKKIIKPISNMDESAPNLDELLAKEGMNLDDAHPGTGESQPSIVSPGNMPPPAPAPAISGLPTTPHPPGHVISPNPSTGNAPDSGTNNIDPNSIAL